MNYAKLNADKFVSETLKHLTNTVLSRSRVYAAKRLADDPTNEAYDEYDKIIEHFDAIEDYLNTTRKDLGKGYWFQD